jgi:cysteinyl-tRNA synthetase
MLFNYFGLREETIEIPEEITKLLDERKTARLNKNFKESDTLRDAILALGYIIKDGPNGQTVRIK